MGNARLELVRQTRMIAVIREDTEESARNIANAFVAAGVPIIEVTMTTPGAEVLIGELARSHPRLLLAAGTVLSENDVARARRAGAHVIVSPHFDSHVVSSTLNAGLLSVAGAGTATEILAAHKAGAHLVKVYPARMLGGPAFIRAVRQPIRGIEMIAGGPVDLEEIADYLDAGCAAVNLGASIAPAEAVLAGDWSRIQHTAARALTLTRDRSHDS